MQQAPLRLEYVGFWARVWASLIDSALLIAVTLPFLRLLPSPAAAPPSGGAADLLSSGAASLLSGGAGGLLAGGAGALLLDWVLPAAAIIAFWLARQATPGKMLIGARIVDARTGGKPGARQAIARYLGYFLSTIPFGLGLLWVGLDRRKQGWHDKIAGTVVVRRSRHEARPARSGVD